MNKRVFSYENISLCDGSSALAQNARTPLRVVSGTTRANERIQDDRAQQAFEPEIIPSCVYWHTFIGAVLYTILLGQLSLIFC